MGQRQSYLSRPNLDMIEELYLKFLDNPQGVDQNWQLFFEGVDFAKGSSLGSLSKKDLGVHNLVQAYRNWGHFEADLDPLKIQNRTSEYLKIEKFGLSKDDYNKSFEVDIGGTRTRLRFEEIIKKLRQAYCGTITAQVAESTPEVRNWFIKEFETDQPMVFDSELKNKILKQIIRTECLEKFLHTRFVGAKRFSIEGADALIPMLEYVVEKGTELGIKEFVIGMAHRGRINVLANFMGKAVQLIFSEFDGKFSQEKHLTGDVKYHLGFSADKETPSGNCHISLAFNPSHLEAVNPVVCGMARAKQRIRNNTDKRDKVVPIQIHGDAAVIGQGIVSETLQLSGLKGYTVGGSVHIIIDNQVGFTTDPSDSRTSPYSSDVSKTLLAPVIHVNGDDAEAAVRAIDVAIRFRQKFKQDVMIRLSCYRRFGHNEGDEPSFTQPHMYKIIKRHPTLTKIYTEKLFKESVIEKGEDEKQYKINMDKLDNHLEESRAKENPDAAAPPFGSKWSGFRIATKEDFYESIDTSVEVSELKKLGHTLLNLPEGFKPHSKIKKLIEKRQKMVEGSEDLDWGFAELLSFASLIKEGTSVRLSGQDSIRGTFTHRHSKYFEVETGEPFNPLSKIRVDREFCVYNSPLSEQAVLGFEYGNAIGDPTYLTIWEAQFGDFANGAQIIIDQFITSGEAKWNRFNGLVLLLPHGYEGQGPEHSSARLERFLQLCAQDNIQVCNLTTPAQIFHVFRRQVNRPFRKPLIIMSPKSLLRHTRATSNIEELGKSRFSEILIHSLGKPEKVEKIVFCSGKLYYELLDQLEKTGSESIALFRIEQLYPFPDRLLIREAKSFTNLKSAIWAQEEPHNMGARFFVMPRIKSTLKKMNSEITLKYVGRSPSASPATGSPKIHAEEQRNIIEECFK